MKKEEAHKEIGRMLGYLASLYNEKHVTHVRNEDVIVKEITMFQSKIHEIVENCISFECSEIVKKIASQLEDVERKQESLLHPEYDRYRSEAIEKLTKQVEQINE